MEQFFVQAKDIQRLLNIPRHRYEYLSTKIGIAPQISRGDGRGHIHRYHSMDLFKFAYVHHANMIGLTPGICKDMLYMLDQVNDYFVKKRKSCGIWEPQSYPGFKEVRDFFYYYIQAGKEFFAFSRKGIKECYFLKCGRKALVPYTTPQKSMLKAHSKFS